MAMSDATLYRMRHDLAIETAASQVGAPTKGQIWPIAAVVCGLGLTAAWVSFLGYVFVRVTMRVI